MSISKLRSKAGAFGQQSRNVNSHKVDDPIDGDSAGDVESPMVAATAGMQSMPQMGANKVVAKPKVSQSPKYKQQQQLQQQQTIALQNQQQQQQKPQPQQQQQQQQQQTSLPQTNLLKIEPFVPSLNTRLRRPFGRSYSTLSSSGIKRTPAGVPALNSPLMGAAIDALQPKKTPTTTTGVTNNSRNAGPRLRRNPARAVTRQRSKSTSSSASNRPTTATAALTSATVTAVGNGRGNHTPTAGPLLTTTPTTTNGCSSTGGAIVTTQSNGICRITRLPHEREKLPDRINYDRRGLTAIPIFEQEPNLRLLSLQHNLINIFHIPKETPTHQHQQPSSADAKLNGNGNAPANGNTTDEAAMMTTSNSSTTTNNSNQWGSPLNRHINARSHANNSNNNNSNSSNFSNVRLPYTNLGNTSGTNAVSLRMQSLTPPPIAPPPSPLSAHPIAMGHGAAHVNHLLQLSRSTLLQKNFNYNNALLPMNHHQAATTPYRFGMKRSKSFVSNYARRLHHMKHNLQQAYQQSKTDGTQLKSFDSGTGSISGMTNTDSNSTLATCSSQNLTELEEEDPLRQLEIKNQQLLASYGAIFQHLVFLDLYDNQIERIGNLDGLPTLSVLLLGKNRLIDISGLSSLRQTLRVLDLHGNKISNISNKINCLQELKSLNLAGNQIRQINQNDFNGLASLKELNLKRNKIKRIHGFQHLGTLERLWLCHNDLHKVEDMASIAKAGNLLEVTIENNPVSLAGDCVSFLVSHLPQLQTLSQMPITEQVRRAAMEWRKNKELAEANAANLSKDVFNSIKREEVISNARTNWELLRSQQLVQALGKVALRSSRQPELEKINESNEAAVGYDDLQEFIKLPPIQQQQQQQQQQKQKQEKQQNEQSNETARDIAQRICGSSGSSLGPNVDSSSSCYSSDSEADSPKLQQCAKGRNGQKQQPTAAHGEAEAATQRNKVTGKSNKLNASQRTNADKTLENGNATGMVTTGDIQQAPAAVAMATMPSTITAKQTVSLKANVNAATTTTMTTATTNTPIAAAAVGTSGACVATSTSVGATPAIAAAATAAAGALAATPQLTIMHANQRNNNSSMPDKPNAHTTTLATTTKTASTSLHQQQQQSVSVAGNVVCTCTPTTQMNYNGPTTTTAFNNNNNNSNGSGMLQLSFKASNNNAEAVGTTTTATTKTSFSQLTPQTMAQTSVTITIAATTATTTPTTNTTTTTSRSTCRRYTQASLLRSQTIVGSINHGNGNSSSSNSLLAANAANEVHSSNVGGRRIHSSHANKTATATAPSSNSSSTISSTTGQPIQTTVTCIVAPPPLAPTATAIASAASKTATTGNKQTSSTVSEREKEQGGDYLIEICGRYLNIYGQGALRYIDKQWNQAKANDVHTLNFSYINFNNIAATVLSRIKSRFPHAENFVFRETNISCLGQLNALAELQGITSLCIDPEGNAITTKDLWRQYAIYRLSHWGLKLLNGVAVTEALVDEANAMYEGLSDLVLWAMPEVMLQPLLARLRLDETCTASKLSPKEWLMKPDNKSLRLVVGKEALQWKKSTTTTTPTTATNCNFGSHTQSYGAYEAGGMRPIVLTADTALASNNTALSMRERGKLHFAIMLQNTCNAVEKLHKLETLWPSLLLDIVRNTLFDYAQLDEYLRNLMSEIMK